MIDNDKLLKLYNQFKQADPDYKIPNSAVFHYENYGPYKPLLDNGSIIINVNKDITKNTWKIHYDSILNILKDAIETDIVQKCFITVVFDNKFSVDLSIFDYWLNLIMWYMLVFTDTSIAPKHLFFDKEFTKNSIKKYIDKFLIDPNRKRFSNFELCNIIDDTMILYQNVNNFSMYLSNTMNLEDTIFMMEADHEVYDILHTDLQGYSIDEYKAETSRRTNRLIEIFKTKSRDILGFDHCHADAFRAKEGVNIKQFTEYAVAIGSKPDAMGNIQSKFINKSFINGGLVDPADLFIESGAGRTAQILTKMNVGESGNFARLLNLNNGDSYLYPDPNYSCDTKNFLKLTIEDETFLNKYANRYYRTNPVNGVEHILIPETSKDLIGKTLYFRSPCTCASNSRGQGICYKCYGDQAYTNNTINIGRIASETLSSVLTQILLSAKHLLETLVEKLNWCDAFKDMFEIDGNTISISDDVDKEWRILIDPESIEMDEDDISSSEDDEDDSPINSFTSQYSEFITQFEMQNVVTGEIIPIYNEKSEKLYISPELNAIIRKKAEPIDGKVSIPVDEDIKEITLFFMNIQNNGLTKTLKQLNRLLNNNGILKNYDLNSWTQDIINTVIKGGLEINGIHLEVIISNQIRSIDDILSRPEWQYPNEPYELVSLNKALTNNPSVTISMSYQKISKLLFDPLTFRKSAPSFMDLFFMERPQVYIKNLDENEVYDLNEDGLIDPLIIMEDKNKITGLENNYDDSYDNNDENNDKEVYEESDEDSD